jgi:2-polyprenyl-6-methoxyphenol hydroxylase-like FAD-dependent oxidoreductase
MSTSILVVGAGIAGQALARALESHQLSCSLVEQRAADSGLGMGLNLPGNATRALSVLGVLEEVERNGETVRRRQYRSHTDRLWFETQDAEFWREVGAPVCVRRGHLLRALERSHTCQVERGARVESVRATADRVEVQVEGEGQPRHYDLVVGADGVNSAVRGAVAAHVPQPSLMTPSSWRFVVDNPGVQCWTAWTGPTATFLLIPVGPGQVYGYAASTRGETGSTVNWLAETFSDYPAPVTQAVASAVDGRGEVLFSAVTDVRLERWQNGRLILLGDAAHATGPVWAQGAAMALEDALVLADLLSHEQDWSRVGAEFERLRRPRVDHVQASTDSFSRLAKLPSWLRNLTAPMLGPKGYRKAYEPLRADIRS